MFVLHIFFVLLFLLGFLIRVHISVVQSNSFVEVVEDDIYLDEFTDEIEEWVIEAIKKLGYDTAKAVLNAPREVLIEKADLEEDTVDHLLEVLKSEFENED